MTITLQKKYTENIPKLLSNTNGNLLSIKHITNQGSGILSEKSFSFTPDFLIRIHQRLFCGVYEHAGQIRHKNISNIQSLTPKSQNDTLNCTLEEMAVLQYLQSNPEAKQEDIAKHIGKSLSTVKRMTPSLIERGLLQRENGKRNGKWVVKI